MASKEQTVYEKALSLKGKPGAVNISFADGLQTHGFIIDAFKIGTGEHIVLVYDNYHKTVASSQISNIWARPDILESPHGS